MAKVYYEKDVTVNVLKEKKVAIIDMARKVMHMRKIYVITDLM